MNNNDWRLTNQMNYLYRKTLKKTVFEPYRDNWEHEHCAFCTKTIDDTTLNPVYTTEDKYHYICEECFEDFKDIFEWYVI